MTLREKELELWKQYRAGNKMAGQQLVKSLKPLINQQIGKYVGVTLPRVAIDMEATKLVYQAFDTYDPEKAQLNTHVTNYLKKLQRFVINYQNVGHIPEPRAMKIGIYNSIYDNIESDKGREPTMAELADEMSWPIKEIEKLQIELRRDLSIEHGTGDEDDVGTFFEYTPDLASPEQFKLRQALSFIYYDSDPIDKKIIEYVFGYGGKPKLKDKDISFKLRLSSQKVAQRKKGYSC